MKVKKFVAKSMSEAMKKIRQELGNDAVILNSKEIETGGFLGFFTKKNIEVIAAVDTAPAVRRSIPKKPSQPVQPAHNPSATPPPNFEKLKQELNKNNKTSPSNETAITNNEKKLSQEVQELKNLVSGISNSIVTQFEDYPDTLKKINQLFIDQDISPNIRIDVMKKLLKKWYIQDKDKINDEEVFAWAKQILAESLKESEIGGFAFNKKFLNLVGPTGVGKTTTIAKIAAHCVLKHKKKVAFITTDTFRIAAIEQLKTYAKILNVPVEVAYSIDDFRVAKEKLQKYDLVLIDSAGRNFLNQLYIDELKKIIDFDEEMETYLVLSLTSKYRDMAIIYEQFSNLNLNKVIFTKKDETYSRGSMINLITEYHVGVAYITNGQSVPDDIVEGSIEEVINSIFEVDSYE